MCELSELLPVSIKISVATVGSEWAVPRNQARQVVRIATGAAMAILGVECLLLVGNGVKFESYSSYEFELVDDWTSFVRRNNEAATEFLSHCADSPRHVYVLVSLSQELYSELA